MYRPPLPFFSCSHDGVTEAMLAHNRLLKKLASHDSAGSWASCRWLTDFFLLGLRCGWGSRAAAPRNGRKTKRTVTVPLRPGARDRPAGGARSRGRRVPIEGVLLLIALLARWRPDDEDRKQLLFVDGTTRPTRPDPMIHTS